MSKLYLLTGATGFVGRQVLQQLLDQGASVRVIVRRGKEHMFEGQKNIESVVSTDDLFAEPPSFWNSVCDGIDTIIHVAWYVEPEKYLTAPENLDCLIGTINFAKAAAAMGVRRFVGIGTCFEYDLKGGVLSTETKLKPGSPYGASKAAAFIALNASLPGLGVELAWCRLFFLFGQDEDPRRLVSYIRDMLSKGEVANLTSGEQQRDYLDVVEAARMIVLTADGDTQGPVNICSGVAPTVRQLAEKLADEYGRRDLLNFGGRAPNPIDPPRIVGVK
ncbi:MAG: NAD(P)-dependent oxidoreductase [Alphaproteobacteria bacterium]|nr:NAD(P)-dependent oxidoreductase [Alphaproteobacteria bacterium]